MKIKGWEIQSSGASRLFQSKSFILRVDSEDRERVDCTTSRLVVEVNAMTGAANANAARRNLILQLFNLNCALSTQQLERASQKIRYHGTMDM